MHWQQTIGPCGSRGACVVWKELDALVARAYRGRRCCGACAGKAEGEPLALAPHPIAFLKRIDAFTAGRAGPGRSLRQNARQWLFASSHCPKLTCRV